MIDWFMQLPGWLQGVIGVTVIIIGALIGHHVYMTMDE